MLQASTDDVASEMTFTSKPEFRWSVCSTNLATVITPPQSSKDGTKSAILLRDRPI